MKYKYGDKVRIIDGFYKGLTGKLLSCHTSIANDKIYYMVYLKLGFLNYKYEGIDEDQMELIK